MPDQTGRPSPFVHSPDRPVFIGASPRSGTTLLRLMLNASPQVAIPRETKVVIHAWEHRDEWGDLRVEANRRKLADWIVSLPGPSSRRFGVSRDEVYERVVSAPPTLGSLLGSCLAAYADHQGKPRWGDKRPVYSRYLDAVFSMFPDAQFIHIVRDPRAASASMARMWYDGKVGPGIELWERSMLAVEPWRAVLGPDQFLELRYETFVEDPQAGLEQIAAFLRLDPSSVDAMMRYHENPDETSPVHPDVGKPPTTENINTWKDALRPEDVALIEEIAAPFMARYGYEPVATDIAPAAATRKSYEARKTAQLEERARLEKMERSQTRPWRRSVAARLTSAQRAGAKHTKFPPRRTRWVGRPL